MFSIRRRVDTVTSWQVLSLSTLVHCEPSVLEILKVKNKTLGFYVLSLSKCSHSHQLASTLLSVYHRTL